MSISSNDPAAGRDAVSSRDEALLSQLVPKVIERLAEQRAVGFDAEASRARFYTWLTAHTEELGANAQSVIPMAGAKATSGDSILELSKSLSARTGGPTAPRLALGGRLRNLRERAGITMESAAAAIRGTPSKINRMEQGRTTLKERDVADLLALYRIGADEEREALLRLARQANTPAWWQAYSDIVPHWVEAYLDLEAAASFIHSFETGFIPALLQTEGYATAVARLSDVPSEEDLLRRVEFLLSRRHILDRPDPPRLWAIIDEAALRRPIGSRQVMREQLQHLMDMCDHPAVTLQVLPFSAGGHPAMGGLFTVLRYVEPDLPDIVYIGQMTGGLYLDRPTEADKYLEVFERISLMANSAWDTPELLSALLDDA